jgi:hypothetical protein
MCFNDGGVAHIVVPDIGDVMRTAIERRLDIEDVLYQSAAGPITVLDVLYGYGPEMERNGQNFFAHKTRFTQQSLVRTLLGAGYPKVYAGAGGLQITALAFKREPGEAMRTLFGLPPG